jgi:hypothetical protein
MPPTLLTAQTPLRHSGGRYGFSLAAADMRAKADRKSGDFLADKSLATFVGGKEALLLGRRDRPGGRGSQNAIPRLVRREHRPQNRLAERACRTSR